MWAVLVALFVDCHILAESLLALLADEGHLRCTRKRVCLRFCMAFGAVEPLLATRGANGNLGIQDVFAMRGNTLVTLKTPGAWDTHHIV